MALICIVEITMLIWDKLPGKVKSDSRLFPPPLLFHPLLPSLTLSSFLSHARFEAALQFSGYTTAGNRNGKINEGKSIRLMETIFESYLGFGRITSGQFMLSQLYSSVWKDSCSGLFATIHNSCVCENAGMQLFGRKRVETFYSALTVSSSYLNIHWLQWLRKMRPAL